MFKIFLKYSLNLIVLLALFGCSDIANQTFSYKKDITEKKVVALMLPLSGQDELMSQKIHQIMKKAFDDAGQNIEIRLFDVHSEETATNALKEVIADDIKIVVGPLYSKHASAIATNAREKNIVMIVLSNNPALADSNIFVYGHAPMKQTEYIINHMIRSGNRNFIALLPAGNTSYNVTKILQNQLIAKQATLVRSEYYAEYSESIDSAVNNVAAAVDILNEDDTNYHKPVIYISDNNANLTKLYDALTKHNLQTKAEIIGNWNIDIDYNKNISYIFTGSRRFENTKLIDWIQENWGTKHISSLEAISYDLALLLAKSIKNNVDYASLVKSLENQNGFIGISGIVRFNDHIAERYYDVIKRNSQEYKLLKKSQDKFTD